MIRRISQIQNLGIFNNYSWDCTNKFEQHNLIFGYNGSGKSTLSNLFNLITSNKHFESTKKQQLFDEIKNSDSAKVIMCTSDRDSDCDRQYPSTRNSINESIQVFNSNFVSQHVFDGQTGKMGKFSGDTTNLGDAEYLKKKSEYDLMVEEINKHEKSQKSLLGTFQEQAEGLRADFNSIFQSKRILKLEKHPPGNIEYPYDDISTIDLEIAKKRAMIQSSTVGEDLEGMVNDLRNIRLEELKISFEDLDTILKTVVSSKSGNRIDNNIKKFRSLPSVETWYASGHVLLKKNKEEQIKDCPLCNSDISTFIDSLLREYEQFFNKEYEELKGKIENTIKSFQQYARCLESNTDNVYKINEITKGSALLKDTPILDTLPNLSETLKACEHLLQDKLEKMDKVVVFNDIEIHTDNLNAYNTNVTKLYTAKELKLKTIEDLQKNTDNNEKVIRDLYKNKYYLVCGGENVEECVKLEAKISTLNEKKQKANADLMEILRKLKTESKKVNFYLEKLGITNFSIDLNEGESENISVIYGGTNAKKRLRNTLSEGEKSALAFAYFLSKVSYESGNNKNQTIIVVDDPISSLDDNRLYRTAHLINEEFKEYKQLFVLSHSLQFLKHVNTVLSKCSTFLIQDGCISDLPKSLQNFQTPYFYMMDEVVGFISDNNHDKYEKVRAYLPNHIRRILETYFGFRYAYLRVSGNKSPGIGDFIKEVRENRINIPDQDIKTDIVSKMEFIRSVSDNFSHGSSQTLDQCSFCSNDELTKMANALVSIIKCLDEEHSIRITPNPENHPTAVNQVSKPIEDTQTVDVNVQSIPTSSEQSTIDNETKKQSFIKIQH